MNLRHLVLSLVFASILLGVTLVSFAGDSQAQGCSADYYVDATLGNDNNPGTMDQPWRTISKVVNTPFSPGDCIHFKRGETWSGESLYVDEVGTATAFIVFDAYGEGAAPRIENAGVSISDAAYVEVRELEVTGHAYAGVAIQQNAHHITVTKMIIHENSGGVWMGDGVGMNNVVSDNDIYLNTGHGIAVDTVFCTPGNETIISANRVYSNVWHGIELSANYHIIEQNVVYANGENPDGTDDMVGHSGIHLFARYRADEEDKGGDYNIIRYNLTYNNKDDEPSATDGNGIQMDMWCDNNQVYNNIAYGNDGPGIISYGGSNNEIYNNTLYDNAQNLGWRLAQTQLMIADSDEVPAANNMVYNNIGYSRDANTYAVFIEEGARSQGNVFSHNLWYNETGGNLLGLGDDRNVDLATWNAQPWADDFSGDPQFVDAAGRDFQLQSGSPAIDAADATYAPTDDYVTVSRPQGSAPDIGAYEYPTTPVFIPQAEIAPLNQADVRIAWDHDDHCAQYDLWRATAPYFTPQGDPVHTTSAEPWQWDDPNARNDPAENHYYLIHCTHFNRGKTSSNRMGEFDFALTPGTG